MGMYSRFLTGVALVSALVFFVPFPTHAAITTTLIYGSSGPEVTELQTFLRSTGDYTYPSITGYFGTATETAVKQYQAREGIVSSGTPTTTGYGAVGPCTRSFITAATNRQTKPLCGQSAARPTASAPSSSSSSSNASPTATNTRVSATLIASETKVARGTAVTLSWTSQNATSCRLSGSGVSGAPTTTSGSFTTKALTRTTSFKILCKGSANTRTASDTESVKVTTNLTSSSTLTITTFTVSPSSITAPGTVMITWSTRNATACTASGGWTGSKATSGAQTITNIRNISSFVLTCSNAGGATASRVKVVDVRGSSSIAGGTTSETSQGPFGQTTATPSGSPAPAQSSQNPGLFSRDGASIATPGTISSGAYTEPGVGGADTEEFLGPFPNWLNVKTHYGAKGDGVSDDTAAIQSALNDIMNNGPNKVVYLPAGTYKISSTLTLRGSQSTGKYFNIIGEHPDTTKIIWNGPQGGVMLQLNGMEQSRFARFTLDGQNRRAGVLIDQMRSGGQWFDTGNEYADIVFKNGDIGYRCGVLQNLSGGGAGGCAESSMLRNTFIGNGTGALLKNFNALDIWFWYNEFENNGIAVSNDPILSGHFNVYSSIFRDSSVADIVIGDRVAGTDTFRNNYSIGSNQFIKMARVGYPVPTVIQNNTVLNTVSPQAIDIGNWGPVVMLDNIIKSSSSQGPAVSVVSDGSPSLTSIGNTYTVNSPTHTNGQFHSLDDAVVAASSINPGMPTLPGTPVGRNRQVFEVAPGSGTAQIQAAINSAAAQNGSRPVVHLPSGGYYIDTTIVVPARSDLQITGDGFSTVLAWTGSGSGPVIRFEGPSKAVLRDLQVIGEKRAVGIEMRGVDQSGSRIFMEQAYPFANKTNLFVDGLEYATVEAHNFIHPYANNWGTEPSLIVKGGPSAASGDWKGSQTNIFAGQTSESDIVYKVMNGGRLSAQDIFYDANGSGYRYFADLSGKSIFTYSGASSFMFNRSEPPFLFNNFQGNAAIVGITMAYNQNTESEIRGDASGANILFLGAVGKTSSLLKNVANPAPEAFGVLNSITTNSTQVTAGSKNPDFLRKSLEQMRTIKSTVPSARPDGVTDLRLYRVFLLFNTIGVHLKP